MGNKLQVEYSVKKFLGASGPSHPIRDIYAKKVQNLIQHTERDRR